MLPLMDDEKKSGWLWERGCYVLLLAIGLVMLAGWLHDCFEALSALMFGFFIVWQVVRGLVIKRYFWFIPEEKVSFWSLAVAFVVALLCFWICSQGGANAAPISMSEGR